MIYNSKNPLFVPTRNIWVPSRKLRDCRGSISAALIGVMAARRETTYSPLSDSSVVYWYKADGTLYTTHDGTTQCSDGNDIGTWVEAKATGKNAIQATESARPTFRSAGGPNSKPCVDFNAAASGERLVATWASALTQAMTIWAVAKIADSSVVAYVCDSKDSSNRVVLYQWSVTSGHWRLYAGGESDDGASTTNWVLLKAIANGASSVISINGGADNAQASAGTNSLGGVTLGARYATTTGNIKIAEVIFQNRAATAGDVTNIGGYLNTKYAIY